MSFASEEHFKKRALRGFSLGEVLLAAFVLTAGLLSVIALMASSLRNSLETRDAIIATGLAQEGIELVRNVRDNDLAAGNDGFMLFSNSAKHCRVDYIAPSTSLDCSSNASDIHSGNPGRYYLQYLNGLYAHANTDSARFSRYIFIDYDPNPTNMATVRSFVYWGGEVPSIPNGSSSNCIVADKCVFTEVTLTAWK